MWWLLLILIACTQIEPQETIYSFVKYEQSSVVSNKSTGLTQEAAVRANVTLPAPKNETLPEQSGIARAESIPIADLTIAQQHKLIPTLESNAKNSKCYEFTWTNLDKNKETLLLSVEKQLRFEYFGARIFKGWILNVLLVQKEQVASQTVKLLWDDGNITCIDEGNFSVDWTKVQRKFELTHHI